MIQEPTTYITTTEAAKRAGVCTQRIRALLAKKRIPGAKRVGPIWMVPENFKVKAAKKRKRAMLKLPAK